MTKPTERTYEVEVIVTVTVDGEEDAARTEVDQILQRAWDTDQGRHHVEQWHFELLDEGLVTDVTDLV